MKSQTLRLVLAVACTVLLVVAVTGTAVKAGKKVNIDKNTPSVQDKAKVYLLVTKKNSHARLVIQNKDGSALTIDESTIADESGKLVQDYVKEFDYKGEWGKTFTVKEIGPTNAAKFNAMIKALEKEQFLQYNYQTNTCGAAALRMLHYLGLTPGHVDVKWLADNMHDVAVRSVISGHTLRVLAAIKEKNPLLDKNAAAKLANELAKELADEKTKKEVIEKIKEYAIDGLWQSLALVGVDRKAAEEKEAAAAAPAAAAAAGAGAAAPAAAKKSIFRQRLQNPKLLIA